ncbi:MFS transporter [Pseudoclavibacter sp. VKM Ac-2888]|uniref:MFS transporter n=1 Tax=Pseudoclavibacter sp. VKM Ac-2888 TaxID=2783830 RepID=UPI00188D595B|nr:MFS transporter [Pseudoclavibacter sp. VKM Ac-2888]MBF4550702.1 MFS transporter [Pseudoclavibacter sp. VKM Ac-2888]
MATEPVASSKAEGAAGFAAPSALRRRGRPDGLILALGVATAFTTLLDQAVFSFAVPSIQRSLDADGAQVQWLTSSYSLAFGLALVGAGRLGDLLGRRSLYLLGLALFAVAGFAAALADDTTTVIIARLVQGFGAGVVNPQVLGLFQDTFRGIMRSRALSGYTTAGSAAGLVGPLGGGILLTVLPDDTGWRLVFLLAVPLAVVLIVSAVFVLPRPSAVPGGVRSALRQVDAVGVVLLGTGTLALLVAAVSDGVLLAALAAAAVALFVLFALWERHVYARGGAAVLHPELARNRGYLLGTAVAALTFGSALGIGLLTTLFLIEGLGYSPFAAALLLTPRALGMVVGSMLSWRLVRRFGRSGITWVLGLALIVVTVEIALVTTGSEPLIVLGILGAGTLQGFFSGLFIPSNQSLTLNEAPPGVNGVAAGFFQLSQRLAAALALSVYAGTYLAVGANMPASFAFGAAASITIAASLGALLISAAATPAAAAANHAAG